MHVWFPIFLYLLMIYEWTLLSFRQQPLLSSKRVSESSEQGLAARIGNKWEIITEQHQRCSDR